LLPHAELAVGFVYLPLFFHGDRDASEGYERCSLHPCCVGRGFSPVLRIEVVAAGFETRAQGGDRHPDWRCHPRHHRHTRLQLTNPRELLDAGTVAEAINVVSCYCEDTTEWGGRVGWIYVTKRDAFRGTAPINLTDRLHQVLRWATGSVEILLAQQRAAGEPSVEVSATRCASQRWFGLEGLKLSRLRIAHLEEVRREVEGQSV
jgi:hypothetical protein